ncbi:hypothetical protein AB0A05_21220 [Streptomyces sp. NPDC046374]|uniref:hypothetical protein n=1 Tax=Streptomyces sp. NPDC046374 TaxID=3154917 RepID=UPI0033F6185A
MRTALRTAVATALLTGLAITPAVATASAFAADGPAATAANDGTLVRTETLADGTVVKVYRLGPASYRAEAFVNGQSVGAIDANGRPAASNNNGAFLVLFEDGRTVSWAGNNAHDTPLGLYRLADGTVLELGKNPKDGRLGLQLVENGKGRGFTYTHDPVRTVWTYGKAVVVLGSGGGEFAAYLPGSARQAAPVFLGRNTPKPTPSPEKPRPPARIISGPTTVAPCTVTEVIASVYGGGWTVALTNDLKKGPKAVLKDEKGKALETVDRAHPGPTGLGMKIDRPDTRAPRFGQHTNGGDTAPYQWNDFPKLPKDCGKKPATPAPTTGTGAGTQGGQTSVVPKGGVAAGAEFGTVEQGNDTALLASGAGAAVVVAGLGFAARRRRAATRG